MNKHIATIYALVQDVSCNWPLAQAVALPNKLIFLATRLASPIRAPTQEA